jgi:hypothetical protein
MTIMPDVGFAVWDAVVDLAPALERLSTQGSEEQPVSAIALPRGASPLSGPAVVVYSFHPQVVPAGWILARPAAMEFAEPLARTIGGDVREVGRRLIDLSRAEGESAELLVDATRVAARMHVVAEDAWVVSSSDPMYPVAVAGSGISLPSLSLANWATWRSAFRRTTEARPGAR